MFSIYAGTKVRTPYNKEYVQYSIVLPLHIVHFHIGNSLAEKCEIC